MGVREQGPSTAHTQESLRPGCKYEVRVRARNAAGFGGYTRPIVISTAPDVPSSPAMPRCLARSLTSLSLEWAAPVHDGGLPVTSYRLEVAQCASHPHPRVLATNTLVFCENLTTAAHGGTMLVDTVG